MAAAKGYPLILVIPDKMSTEKIAHLRAFGADIRLTRSDVCTGHPDNYQDMAARIARETPGAWFVNQFANPANPLAHERTTGPEIVRATGSTCGRDCVRVGLRRNDHGLSRYFAGVSPETEIVLADPVGSSLAEYIDTGTLGH